MESRLGASLLTEGQGVLVEHARSEAETTRAHQVVSRHIDLPAVQMSRSVALPRQPDGRDRWQATSPGT